MKVLICSGQSCTKKGGSYIETRLQSDILHFEYDSVEIESCLCQGSCINGPNIRIDTELFSVMNPAKASVLLAKKIKQYKGTAHFAETHKK